MDGMVRYWSSTSRVAVCSVPWPGKLTAGQKFEEDRHPSISLSDDCDCHCVCRICRWIHTPPRFCIVPGQALDPMYFILLRDTSLQVSRQKPAIC